MQQNATQCDAKALAELLQMGDNTQHVSQTSGNSKGS